MLNGFKVPNHLAVILDGNRRWAKQHKMPPWKGHWEGGETADKFLDWCLELGIPQVSMWIGSTENLRVRPKREVKELVKVYLHFLERLEEKQSILDKYQIKVRFIGDIERLPKKLIHLMGKIMAKTAKYQKRFLNVLINYGGKFELLEVMKKLAQTVIKLGKFEISEKFIEKNLMVSVPVDLIIRTGGYSRLSNFMLWQSAYSEIYVTDTLWPDFSKRELIRAIKWFNSMKRNYGK